VALAGLGVLAGTFLAGLAAKERDDRFCISCHLHEAKFTRFRSPAPSDLAGLHHRSDDVRCIDCHGGADPVMRVRVWTVAGIDTLRFLAGRYREPDHMRLPLRDAECARCHTPILKARRALATGDDESLGGSGGDTYHAIRAHDGVEVACVRCHASHTTDSEPALMFIAASRVQPICRECHETLGE
jgi:predicted CXXCH cytochrome family protein